MLDANSAATSDGGMHCKEIEFFLLAVTQTSIAAFSLKNFRRKKEWEIDHMLDANSAATSDGGMHCKEIEFFLLAVTQTSIAAFSLKKS